MLVTSPNSCIYLSHISYLYKPCLKRETTHIINTIDRGISFFNGLIWTYNKSAIKCQTDVGKAGEYFLANAHLNRLNFKVLIWALGFVRFMKKLMTKISCQCHFKRWKAPDLIGFLLVQPFSFPELGPTVLEPDLKSIKQFNYVNNSINIIYYIYYLGFISNIEI